jgi:hypothetical protein
MVSGGSAARSMRLRAERLALFQNVAELADRRRISPKSTIIAVQRRLCPLGAGPWTDRLCPRGAPPASAFLFFTEQMRGNNTTA